MGSLCQCYIPLPTALDVININMKFPSRRVSYALTGLIGVPAQTPLGPSLESSLGRAP